MSVELKALYAAAGLVLIVLIVLLIVAGKKLPRKSKAKRIKVRWKNLQKLLRDPAAWPNAIEQADALLDKALKRRSIKGSNMGERLVNAQKIFTDSDSVWAAHKLKAKLEQNPKLRLAKGDVKRTLLSFGQALKDLGAL